VLSLGGLLQGPKELCRPKSHCHSATQNLERKYPCFSQGAIDYDKSHIESQFFLLPIRLHPNLVGQSTVVVGSHIHRPKHHLDRPVLMVVFQAHCMPVAESSEIHFCRGLDKSWADWILKGSLQNPSELFVHPRLCARYSQDSTMQKGRVAGDPVIQ